MILKNVLFCCQETVGVVEVRQTSAVTEEDDDEESHFSEGQIVMVSSQSVSDDTEISEELEEPEDGGSYVVVCNFRTSLMSLKPPFVRV